MKVKWLIRTIAIAMLVVVALFGLAGHDSIVAAQDQSSKIDGALLDKFSTDGNADFIVRFTEQADLSAAYAMDWNARGEFVYNALVNTAAKSQVNAKAILDAGGAKYQTQIGGNDLYVWSGTLADANAIAALPEVYYIRIPRTFAMDPVTIVKPLQNIAWAGDYLAKNALVTVGSSPNAVVDWGITDTKADLFWSSFGTKGAGIKVANIDSGVQWDHPALINQYACAGDPGNNACWEDPSNVCGGTPCGNGDHGTHTMGTMVASDDPSLPYTAGMAPDATWIACLGCDVGSSCSEFALTTCGSWLVAPGGDPANRPNVVNNSWGGTPDGDPWYLTYVNNWRAAGIFPAFSAGNSGPTCSSMGDPGSYQESFAAAAHDVNRSIASFSSRGDSAFGHIPYTKPNISAPGVNICSTVTGNGWDCTFSGTSMASPHDAGAVALLWACNPDLVGQIDTTFQLLQNTADAAPAGNCGAPGGQPGNYTFGYGYLDVLAAGISGCGNVEVGHLDGYVYDNNGDPVEGASVSAAPGTQGNQIDALTDPTGYYTMTLVVGTYNVTASKVNFAPQTVSGVQILNGVTTHQNFTINFLGSWTLGPASTPVFDLYRFDGEFYPGTGLVYFLGGRTGTPTDGNIYSFNPVTEVYADTGVDMPNPVSNYTVDLINDGTNDLLCTFGGRQADTFITLNVQCFNPNTNTASVVTDLPAAWTGLTPGANVVVNNMVYIFGGFDSPGGIVSARTDRYDPITNTFTQLGDLNLARSYIMATAVDGIIYAFGGDTWDGVGLIAQTIAEKMDPAVGTWDDAGVADLPMPGDEGQAFGFNSGVPFVLANQIVIATMAQWSGNSNEVILYDVATDTYDVNFPNLINARRNHAGVFIPIETPDPLDGLPGMWVFGGWLTGDAQPFAPTEFYPLVNTTPKPVIKVTPDSLSATLMPNETTTRTLTIQNIGTLPLDWGINEIPGMKVMSVTPVNAPAAAAPRKVTLSVDGKPASGAMTNVPVIPNDAISLVVDDGSAENSVGVTDGVSSYQFIWLNRFTPALTDLPFSLNQIQVLFPTAAGVSVGDAFDLVVYHDADGDPSNGATWLATFNVTVQAADGTTWSVYDLPSGVPITGPGDVLIAAINRYVESGVSPAAWPAAIDETLSVQRSWLGWWNVDPPDPAVLPPDLTFGVVDDFGLPGNWLIRGVGENPVDVPWLSEVPTSGTLAPGESVAVVVTFDDAGMLPGDYSATLAVFSNDPVTPEVDVPVTMTVLAPADLGISKTDAPDPVRVGSDLTYTLVITNSGPYTGTTVTVVDTLPAGVTFKSASVGCVYAAGKVTCHLADIGPDGAALVTIVVTPNVEGLIVNSATVTSAIDPNPANDTATAETTVIPATLYQYLPLVMRAP